MLNKDQKLNQKLFNDDVEQIPIRKGFGEGLVIVGGENENVVALCADLTESTQMQAFKDKFSERYIEVGVAEQNLVTIASGMSAIGKIPFVSSYAMFSPGRNWEQIRTTIAYNNRAVIIVGSHAGISVGPDGGTHQAIEDLAIMRVMPNMLVISPCDSIEAKKATIALAKLGKPAYLRLAREKTPVMTTDDSPFEIGKADIVYRSEGGLAHVGIIATGALLHKALLSARKLEKSGIRSVVLNIHTIKPIDEKSIIALARETKAIVTIEEHQISGGLGGAISEVLAQYLPTPIEFIGVHDQFGQSGKSEELLKYYKMDTEDIIEAVKRVIERKN